MPFLGSADPRGKLQAVLGSRSQRHSLGGEIQSTVDGAATNPQPNLGQLGCKMDFGPFGGNLPKAFTSTTGGRSIREISTLNQRSKPPRLTENQERYDSAGRQGQAP
jgi:hypothetical protein